MPCPPAPRQGNIAVANAATPVVLPQRALLLSQSACAVKYNRINSETLLPKDAEHPKTQSRNAIHVFAMSEPAVTRENNKSHATEGNEALPHRALLQASKHAMRKLQAELNGKYLDVRYGVTIEGSAEQEGRRDYDD